MFKGKNQLIRFIYLIICIMLLIQLFVPIYVDYSSYSHTISTGFNFGLNITLDLDTFMISDFHFFFTDLISVLPTIVALILLIILLFLLGNLERGGILGLGITSACFMIVGPVINQILNYGFLDVYFPSYYILGLCAAILVLGLISIIRAPETPHAEASKVSGPSVVEAKPIVPTCSKCGAVIRPGSQFCVECGNKF